MSEQKPATGHRADVPCVPLWRLLLHQFSRDGLFLRASGLAYITLASLIPVVAIMLAILAGPAFQESREDVVGSFAAALVPAGDSVSQQHLSELFEQEIRQLAERAGAVGIFGFLVLAATAGLLFATVEDAFNVIWRAHSQRPFFMRVAIATSLLFWFPVALAISISLSQLLPNWPLIGTYLFPGLFTMAVFTAFYMIMPHAKVNFTTAVAGAFTATIFWEISKRAFLFYVSRVVSYSAVYGSLGLIPMLLLWLYITWLVVLIGAELAYTLQHRRALSEQWESMRREAHEHKQAPLEALAASPSLMLAAAIEIVRRFALNSHGGVRVSELAEALNVEQAQARQAAAGLVEGAILVQVAPPEAAADTQTDDPAFLPAAEPTRIPVPKLLAACYHEVGLPTYGFAWEQARGLLEKITNLHHRELTEMSLAELAAPQPRPAPTPPNPAA